MSKIAIAKIEIEVIEPNQIHDFDITKIRFELDDYLKKFTIGEMVILRLLELNEIEG